MPGRGNLRGLWSGAVARLLGGRLATSQPVGSQFHNCSLNVAGSAFIRTDDVSSEDDYNFGDTFSVMAWYLPDTTVGVGLPEIILDLRTVGSKNGLLLLRDDTGSGDLLEARTFDSGVAVNNLTTATGFDQFDGWIQLVYTKDGGDEVLYFNGESVASDATAETMSSVDRQCTIGAAGGGSNDLVGAVYQVAVWNTALSAQEALSLWTHGAPMAANLASKFESYTSGGSLVSWYKLGDDSAIPGKDFGPNGNDLTGGDATDDDYIAGAPQDGAIRYSGSGELIANTTNQAIGVANTFSMLASWDVTTNQSGDTIIDISDSADDVNRILLQELTTDYRISLFDSGGTVFKGYDYGFLVHPGTKRVWTLITWDGTTLKTYWNGYEFSPTLTTDNSGTMTDTNREVHIGSSKTAGGLVFGNIFSIALWDKVLTFDEMTSLWYEGAGALIDLRKNFLAYKSGSSLVHWWVPGGALTGEEGGDFITDRVASGGIDLSANASGITNVLDLASIGREQSSGNSGLGSALTWPTSLDARLETLAAIDPGIGDAFTVCAWVWPDGVATGEKHIINFKESGTDNNRIQLMLDLDIASDPLVVKLYDSSGTEQKNYEWGVAGIETASRTWHHAAFTWDGTNLTTYINGHEEAPTKTTDNALTMITANRFIALGAVPDTATGEFGGDLTQVAYWDSELTAAEIRYIFRKGYFFDAGKNNGNYVSSANLQGWWRPGADATSLGRDYSSRGRTLDDEVNIDTDDIRAGGPGILDG